MKDKDSFPNPATAPSASMLGLVGALSLIFGLGTAIIGTSAIHQILTGVYFLIFAVCLAALAIVRSIYRATVCIRNEIQRQAGKDPSA